MLTLFMPTQDRPELLGRALNFYASEKLIYPLIIADSSNPKNKFKIKSIIDRSSLDIKFFEYPHNFDQSSKIRNALNSIETEFTLMIADDDLLVPVGIEKCVKFLNQNKSFSAASGRSYVFSIRGNEPKNLKYDIEVYNQIKITSPDAEKRIKLHFRNWATSAYSVQKTSIIRDVANQLESYGDDIRSKELLWYATSAIRGNIATLDVLYMLRQKGLKKEWKAKSFEDWTKTDQFKKNQKLLIESLSRELCQKNNKSTSHNFNLCHSEIQRWMNERKPFKLRRMFSLSLNYYWKKFQLKILKTHLNTTQDREQIERLLSYIQFNGQK